MCHKLKYRGEQRLNCQPSSALNTRTQTPRRPKIKRCRVCVTNQQAMSVAQRWRLELDGLCLWVTADRIIRLSARVLRLSGSKKFTLISMRKSRAGCIELAKKQRRIPAFLYYHLAAALLCLCVVCAFPSSLWAVRPIDAEDGRWAVGGQQQQRTTSWRATIGP